MADIETSRLTLHPVDRAEAHRIRGGERAPDDRWVPDYPFDGDRIALSAFLAAWERDGDQRPFGYYRIARRADGRSVGGIGFKGQPDQGVVEVGYGLAPSGRGHGYAAEALTALTDLAARHGVSRVRAETSPDNAASVRTLERAGFARVGSGDGLLHYEFATD